MRGEGEIEGLRVTPTLSLTEVTEWGWTEKMRRRGVRWKMRIKMEMGGSEGSRGS